MNWEATNKVICLHQLIRPAGYIPETAGAGICSICKYDPDNNPDCINYHPVTCSLFDVEG